MLNLKVTIIGSCYTVRESCSDEHKSQFDSVPMCHILYGLLGTYNNLFIRLKIYIVFTFLGLNNIIMYSSLAIRVLLDNSIFFVLRGSSQVCSKFRDATNIR